MSVSFDFSGKVALITGSSSGIGAATALLLAKSGAQVVVTGRNAQRVQSVAKQVLEVSPKSLKAHQVVADISNDEDIDRLIQTTIEVFGKIDILVNSAGIFKIGSITDSDYIEKYRTLMNTNLNSYVYLTHKCVQYLEKTKGNIINISGVTAVQSGPNISVICASKAALDMWTKCIAVELGPKGIRVNGIDVGAVRTDIPAQIGLSKDMVTKLYDLYGTKYPVGRCGEGIDIANTVLFLSSEQASFITGTNMVVDGGHLAANTNMNDALKEI